MYEEDIAELCGQPSEEPSEVYLTIYLNEIFNMFHLNLFDVKNNLKKILDDNNNYSKRVVESKETTPT